MPRIGGPNAEARERTRQALLDAGAALLREMPVDELLSQVKVKDVARRAGLTPGAVYHYWENQEAFRLALLERILEPARFRVQGELEGLVAAIGREADRPGEMTLRGMTRIGGRENFDSALRNASTSQLQFSLWAKHDDDQVASLLRDLYRSGTTDIVSLYEQVVAAAGRRFRPPFDAGSLAVVLTALVEGLVMRRVVDPDAVPDDLTSVPRMLGEPEDPGEGPWDLFSTAAYFLAGAMTEPATDAETTPRSPRQHARTRPEPVGEEQMQPRPRPAVARSTKRKIGAPTRRGTAGGHAPAT
jgi:AcrR family transcriptional regulator